MRRIARQASEAGDWTTPQLRIPSGTDPVKRVASALLELSSKAGLASAREKRIGELLHRVEAVAVSGISLSIHASEGPEPYMALSNLLVEIGRAAIRRRNTMVVLHIDEVQNITDEHVALQLFVAEGWPVADGAGGVGRVFMEAKAQRAIVELACGEPFLFQLAGERAWYAGTEDVITAEHVRSGWREAAPETEAHMQRVLDRLPAREREFLQAMAELEPEERSLTNIARKMGYRKTTDAGPTAQQLDVSRGIIHRGRPHSFRNRAVGAYLTSDWPRLSPCPLLPTSPGKPGGKSTATLPPVPCCRRRRTQNGTAFRAGEPAAERSPNSPGGSSWGRRRRSATSETFAPRNETSGAEPMPAVPRQ